MRALPVLVGVICLCGSVLAEPSPPLHPRLRDASGDVAGLPGWTLRRTADSTRCGGYAVVVKRGKKVDDDDKHLAAVLALEFPTGLDFNPDNAKAQKASLVKFNAWVETATKLTQAAVAHHEAQLQSKDPATRARAAARIVQIRDRFASVMARGEIPRDVRSGELAAEKIAAYCEQLGVVATPIVESARTASEACRPLATAAGDGWWTAVCAE